MNQITTNNDIGYKNNNENNKNVINRVFSNKILLSHIFNLMHYVYPRKLATFEIKIKKTTGKCILKKVCGVDINRFIDSNSHKDLPGSCTDYRKYKDICYFNWMVSNRHYNLLFEKVARKEMVLSSNESLFCLLESHNINDLDLLFRLYRISKSCVQQNVRRPYFVFYRFLKEPILPLLAVSGSTHMHINNEKLLDFFYVEQRFRLHFEDIIYCIKTQSWKLLELISKYQQLSNQDRLQILVAAISSGLETISMIYRIIPSIFIILSTKPSGINFTDINANNHIDDNNFTIHFNKLQSGSLFLEILNFNDIDLVNSIKEYCGLYIHINSLEKYINTCKFRNDILELCFISYRDQIKTIEPSANSNINDLITNYGFQIYGGSFPPPSTGFNQQNNLPQNIQCTVSSVSFAQYMNTPLSNDGNIPPTQITDSNLDTLEFPIYRFNLEFKETLNENEKLQFMITNYQKVISNELPFLPHSDHQLPIIRYLYNTQFQLTQPHITLIVSAYNGLLDIFTFIINHRRFSEYISENKLSVSSIIVELFLFSLSNKTYDIIQYLVTNQPFLDQVCYDEILLQCINNMIGRRVNVDLLTILHPILKAKHTSKILLNAFIFQNSDLVRYIMLNYREINFDFCFPFSHVNPSTVIEFLGNYQYINENESTINFLNDIIHSFILENQTELMAIFIQEKYRIHLNNFIKQEHFAYLKEFIHKKMLDLLSPIFPSLSL